MLSKLTLEIKIRKLLRKSCLSAIIYVMSKLLHLSPSEHRVAVRASQVGVQRPLFIVSVHWSGFSLSSFFAAIGFVPYLTVNVLTNIWLKERHNTCTWPC